MKELSQLTAEQIQQAIAQCCQEITANPESAVTLQPDSLRLHRALAQTLTQLGKDRQAADHLFKLFKLKADSLTPRQLYQLGQTLAAQAPDKAIACYRGAINCQPDFFEAYQALGELLAAQRKYEPVLEVYRLGVRNNPGNAQYYIALAQALAAQEKWLWASRNYKKAADLDPSANIYYHWGLALYKLQEYPQAEECWQKAISMQTEYWEAYYQLGMLWQEQQQWQKAIATYQKVIDINPQFSPVLFKLGLVNRNLQHYGIAISCYRRAIKNNPQKSALETEVIADYQETLANLETSNKHSQADLATWYYQFAKFLRARSFFPEAITAYQKSIKLEPNYQFPYIELQYTPTGSEQLVQLIEFYRQIVAQHPKITIAWGNLGDALTQQNRIDEAIDCYRTGCYQKAIQTYPHLAKLNWQESKKCGPDFIIAGASKSGTSSIYFYLSRHPQILLSHTKEIDFYWQNFDRGIDWYLAHFPTITDRDDFLTGEATPNYLRFPQVAQRIKNTFPQTKIIILLRNPADRAISWHYHKLNTGLTNQDLPTAISEEITRLATVSEAEIIQTGYYNPDNILSSLYIYKIRAWVETLGREQFLFLKSEDFYSDPLGNMAQVFDFLGLPNCPLENYPKVNAGSYNQVDSKLRKTLVDYFAPYNRQLEKYLEMEFNWQ